MLGGQTAAAPPPCDTGTQPAGPTCSTPSSPTSSTPTWASWWRISTLTMSGWAPCRLVLKYSDSLGWLLLSIVCIALHLHCTAGGHPAGGPQAAAGLALRAGAPAGGADHPAVLCLTVLSSAGGPGKHRQTQHKDPLDQSCLQVSSGHESQAAVLYTLLQPGGDHSD